MLSRRPSSGLFTYNFELGHLRVTKLDSETSLRLEERDYSAKLVLTLRQFRDAPRRGTKKVESGYLFILHSGTNAIERLDLRKVRQSTSHGAAPAYKIRAESGSIDFQYYSSDYNIRKIHIEFRKEDEYERALQILLSQGLSIIIKKPEQRTPSGNTFVPTVSGPLQPGIPPRSFSVRQGTVPHVPGAWSASSLQASHFTSREVRTSSIPMPPPVAHNARSSTRFGVALGYYNPGRPYSPVRRVSRYYTPSQSQSQLSEEAFPGFGWPPSQQPDHSFDSALPRDFLHISSTQGLPQTNFMRPTASGTRYETPQSFISSQSHCDPSFPENGILGQEACQHHNDGGRVNTPAQMMHDNLEHMLPPTRTLPFKSKSKKTVADGQSVGPTSRTVEKAWDGETMNTGRESQRHQLHNPRTLGEEYTPFKKSPKERSHGGRAETMLPPESRYSATGAASKSNTHHDLAVDGLKRRLGTPHLPTTDSYPPTDTTMMQTSRSEDVDESLSASDTELLSIFRTLEDTVERWRMSLQKDGPADLGEVLSNLQNMVQRLHIYLHPGNHDSRNDRSIEGHLGARTAAGTNQLAHQPATAIVEANRGSKRRHTREYKQWKDYYLLACRLYETKEERTDPEFIHRFLRGIPGKKALRWVQMGLLHCYPSMVRLSERRSGTTIVFTKELSWSQVCEMVTRKLKLPFPKWEVVK